MITLTAEQYTALVALARRGTRTQDEVVRLEEFLHELERANGVQRYLLWVQWQEKEAPLPAGTRFPEEWPAKQRYRIERLDRPIARVDVDKSLRANAKKPMNVLVTQDPAGVVGWTEYDVYFS